MVINRTNRGSTQNGDACFEAMARHARLGRAATITPPVVNPAVIVASTPPPRGDIIYGADAIAAFIFGDDVEPSRARRRVYNLWTHYRDREKKAGLFKLNGALCLSKSQWRAFHGLG